ncbi:tyrosine-type recombinase/integrase [Treponema berlinense]|uniref:tyrosine-type recombinase/integrase n=1 Tax=Treponema berlinense TaxID=225004 RepID=UPI0023F9CE9E|nr:tyrosine-type recombinase/integrase [Treponema berlinense]
MDTPNRLMELEWDNDEAKIANELAMHTGMRAGEIQTLTVDDLGEDEIYVRRSGSKYDGLKCCKNGEERSVPIPISHQLYLKLKMLADFNPHGNGFIFYSTIKDKPMDSKQFNKYLKRALAEIGYADSKRYLLSLLETFLHCPHARLCSGQTLCYGPLQS